MTLPCSTLGQKNMVESKKILFEKHFLESRKEKNLFSRCYLDNQYYYRSIYYLSFPIFFKSSFKSNFMYFNSHKSIKRLRYLISLNSKKKPR